MLADEVSDESEESSKGELENFGDNEGDEADMEFNKEEFEPGHHLMEYEEEEAMEDNRYEHGMEVNGEEYEEEYDMDENEDEQEMEESDEGEYDMEENEDYQDLEESDEDEQEVDMMPVHIFMMDEQKKLPFSSFEHERGVKSKLRLSDPEKSHFEGMLHWVSWYVVLGKHRDESGRSEANG